MRRKGARPLQVHSGTLALVVMPSHGTFGLGLQTDSWANPAWASFALAATAAGATTFQQGTGVAECTSGWHVKDIGGVAVGCSTVPMSLWFALGVQCQTGTTAPPASIPQVLACQMTSEVSAVKPSKVELACATDNEYLDNVTWSS